MCIDRRGEKRSITKCEEGVRSTEGGTRTLRGSSVKGDVIVLREELKKKDKELLTSVERLSSLEGALKRNDKELEVSRDREAQCHDLQVQVDQL